MEENKMDVLSGKDALDTASVLIGNKFFSTLNFSK